MTLAIQPKLTLDDTKAALTDILDALLAPSNKEKLDDARKVAGNDMMKMMHHVFPLVTKIQQDVIQKYGFGPDGEDAIKFVQTVRQYEIQDAEVAQLALRLKSNFLPPHPTMAPPQTP